MKILLIAVMLVHSWYDEQCCHDKDCHPGVMVVFNDPVPVENPALQVGAHGARSA